MFCLNWKIYTKLTWLKISWPGSSTIFWKFWRFWDLTSFWELTPNNCLVRNLSGLFILFTRKSDQRAPEHRIISRRFKFCLNQSFQFFPQRTVFCSACIRCLHSCRDEKFFFAEKLWFDPTLDCRLLRVVNEVTPGKTEEFFKSPRFMDFININSKVLLLDFSVKNFEIS